jgi:hypothetical protein
MLRTETPGLTNNCPILSHTSRTPPAHDVVLVQLAVERGDFVPQKPDHGRVGEQVVPVGLAPRTVARLVGLVPVLSVVLDPFGCDLVGVDFEQVDPPLYLRVVACSGWVVFEEAWDWAWWLLLGVWWGLGLRAGGAAAAAATVAGGL